MAVKIRGEPVRPIHAGRVQCLPAVFHRIERGVHHDAMRMEMGIEFPAGIVPEARRHEIARYALTVLPRFTHARLRQLF